MTAHRIATSQFIARPIEDVFAFFASPRNLARITPAGLGFEYLTDDIEAREGLRIAYRLRPLFGVPVTWHTLIDRFDPPHGFRDIQVKGPYTRWIHEHKFRAVDGGTIVEDHVAYELPLGRAGDVAHGLVQGELDQIFRHRARTIATIFATPDSNPEPSRVVVAGGTGFVGGSIANELYRRGHHVRVLSHRGEAARGGLPDAVELRTADVTIDDPNLVDAVAGADALVIALAFPNSPIEAPRKGRTFERVDAEGTERLVDAAVATGVQRIIYLSGAGAAPDAPRHWFRAKWRAEQAVRGSGIPFTIIRPTWIYGPRDVSLNRFLEFARHFGIVPMTNFGRQRLAPVFIGDVANLAADAIVDANARDQVFELGGPEDFSMREVTSRALSVAGLRRPIVPAPAPLVKVAAAPLSLLPAPPLTPDAVDFINQPATVDVAPLLARMPRRLTPLDEGLASYLAPTAGPGVVAFDDAPGKPARQIEAPSGTATR
jgi:uncharacterized protein YbjT (DUF2867 family)/ligand-binding SRPBCC domain-containing protein